MATQKRVALSSIDANPHRDLKLYPFRGRKIDALRESIEATGFWEGSVIVRPAGDRFQCAFGHHRIEAARQELGEDAKVAVTVRPDMSDELMLMLMARENQEEYGGDFMVMFETWMAAVTFLGANDIRGSDIVSASECSPAVLAIATLVGWTDPQGKDGVRKSNALASTCAKTRALLDDGRMDLADFAGLSPYAVNILVGALAQDLEAIENLGAKNRISRREIDSAKKTFIGAAKIIATEVREGKLPVSKIVSNLEANGSMRMARKGDPEFVEVAKTVGQTIGKWLAGDVQEEKLKAFIKVAHEIPEEQRKQFDLLAYDLGQLAERARKYEVLMKEAVTAVGEAKLAKVVPFRQIEGAKS